MRQVSAPAVCRGEEGRLGRYCHHTPAKAEVPREEAVCAPSVSVQFPWRSCSGPKTGNGQRGPFSAFGGFFKAIKKKKQKKTTQLKLIVKEDVKAEIKYSAWQMLRP